MVRRPQPLLSDRALTLLMAEIVNPISTLFLYEEGERRGGTKLERIISPFEKQQVYVYVLR